MKKQHLSTSELAARWGMAPGTLVNWRMKGRGPKFLKVGWSVRYVMKEVEKWERANMRKRTH